MKRLLQLVFEPSKRLKSSDVIIMRRRQNFKLIEWNQHNYLLMALIVSTKA